MKINTLIFSLLVIIFAQSSELFARAGGGGRNYGGGFGGGRRGADAKKNQDAPQRRGGWNTNWSMQGWALPAAPARQLPAGFVLPAYAYGSWYNQANEYNEMRALDAEAPDYDLYEEQPDPQPVAKASEEINNNNAQDKVASAAQALNPAVINVAARMTFLKDRPFLPENVQEAVKLNDMKTINEFLKDPKNIDASDVNGRTLLIMAVKANNKQLVADLLRLGADTALTDVTLLSPLHYAAFLGRLDLIQEIVPQWLSRPDKIFVKDKNGDTPQDLANKRGHKEIVEYLEKFKQ